MFTFPTSAAGAILEVWEQEAPKQPPTLPAHPAPRTPDPTQLLWVSPTFHFSPPLFFPPCRLVSDYGWCLHVTWRLIAMALFRNTADGAVKVLPGAGTPTLPRLFAPCAGVCSLQTTCTSRLCLIHKQHPSLPFVQEGWHTLTGKNRYP